MGSEEEVLLAEEELRVNKQEEFSLNINETKVSIYDEKKENYVNSIKRKEILCIEVSHIM